MTHVLPPHRTQSQGQHTTKPMLFNTDMVKAILRQQKTVTRRVVKPRYRDDECGFQIVTRKFDGAFMRVEITDENEFPTREMQPPNKPGDILYVRETWNWVPCNKCDNNLDCDSGIKYKDEFGCFDYRADYKKTECKWRPSIHMPKKAARIFLRVKNVFVQKIQDITDEQARVEGCKDRDDFKRVWNKCYVKPQPVKENGVVVRYESYPWEDIRESRTYRGLPWDVIGNPWVWVIEFERISKEEAGL